MAQHIVDALVVTLGLDTSNYDKGKKKVEKDTDDLAKKSSKLEDGILSLGKGFARFFASISASNALVSLAKQVSQANDELNFLSHQLGISTGQIKAFQGAAEASGGSAQGMTNSMKGLNNAALDFKNTGNPALQSAMNALNVNMIDSQGHIKRTDTLMLDLAESMHKMKADDAYFYGQKIGLDEGTVSTLIQGRDAMKDMIAYQKTMYQASKQDLANSRELQKNRAILNSQWESMKTLMASAVIPVLNKLAVVAIQFFEFLQRHQHTVKAVFETMAIVIGTLVVGNLTKALGVLLRFIAPFTPFIATVTALAGAFVLLYDDYKTWAEGGNSLFKWDAFSGYIDTTTLSVDNLKNAFNGAWQELKNNLVPTLKGYAEIIGDIKDGNFKLAGKKALAMGKEFLGQVGDTWDRITGHEVGTARNIDIMNRDAINRTDTTTVVPSGFRNKNFTNDKAKEIVRVAKAIGVNPNDLASVISFETGGTFDPSKRNKGSSATGLIQFMKGSGGTPGKYYGMSRDDFGKLSFSEQMHYVEKYFKGRDKRFTAGNEANNSVGDLYGAVTGWGYKRGSKAYEQNKVWDSNHDGVIEKGEMVQNPSFRAHQRNYFNTGIVSQNNALQAQQLGAPTANVPQPQLPSNKVDVKVGDINVHTSSSTVSGVSSDAMGAINKNISFLIPPMR